MISTKELRIDNLVKDRNGNIWRVGCVTNMHNESGSLILKREINKGIMTWYSGEDDVMPIKIDDNILDTIGFKLNKRLGIYIGYGMSIEVCDDGYYLGLIIDAIKINDLHHLQNLLMDLYGQDIDIDKLYGYTGK